MGPHRFNVVDFGATGRGLENIRFANVVMGRVNKAIFLWLGHKPFSLSHSCVRLTSTRIWQPVLTVGARFHRKVRVYGIRA